MPGDLRGLPVGGEITVPALDAGAVVVLPDLEIGAGADRRSVAGVSTVRELIRRSRPERGPTAGSTAIADATRSLMAVDVAVGGSAAGPPRTAMRRLDAATRRSICRRVRPACASALLARAISLDALLAVAAGHDTAAVTSGEMAAVDDALAPAGGGRPSRRGELRWRPRRGPRPLRSVSRSRR